MGDTPRAAAPPVIVLVRDMMLSSRITATARAAGVPVTLLRDPAQLAAAATASDASRLILDLNQPGAIDAAVAWKAPQPNCEAIGFVSHVDADTIARARAAGIDRVLPRSRFVEMLPELLTGEPRTL